MIQKIVPVTDPKLREKSKKVTAIDKKIRLLIRDLHETLKAQNDPEGVGLAASQIGKNVCIFVINYKGVVKTVINPEIVNIGKIPLSKGEKKRKTLEGCLSLPHYYGPLTRSPKITIKYINTDSKEVTETFEGIYAQIVQHEIDHLEGVLFIDRLIEQKKTLYEYKDGEWEDVELI